METYTGIIIEESLIDNRLLNTFSILSVRITNESLPAERWHIYRVEATKTMIHELASNMSDSSKWYTHFWNTEGVIVVFKDRIFEYVRDEFEAKKHEVINYGIQLGIPSEQLDFPVDIQM